MQTVAVGRVRRRIRFFAWESLPDRPEFDLRRAIQAVLGLDDSDWRHEANDMTTGAIVDAEPAGNDPARLRFFRLREGDDVPHKMDVERMTTPIEVLQGESITDWTHAVI